MNSYLIDFWIKGLEKDDGKTLPIRWLRNAEDENELKRIVSEECEQEIVTVLIQKIIWGSRRVYAE